jgi:hypothetical protein
MAPLWHSACPTISPGNKTTPFMFKSSFFETRNDDKIFYQDRLGTKAMKTQKEACVFA